MESSVFLPHSCPFNPVLLNCSSLPLGEIEVDSIALHDHWVGDAIQPSHPLLPSSPLAFNLSQYQGLFQRVICSHQVAKVLELQFSISPSNEYSGLISFRMDWLDLLAVQGTFKSLLQHYSSKASILQGSAFFMVHSHIHTWLLEKPKLWLDRPCQQSNVSAFYRETCISLPSNPPSASQTGCSLRLKYNGITLLQWLHVTHG